MMQEAFRREFVLMNCNGFHVVRLLGKVMFPRLKEAVLFFHLLFINEEGSRSLMWSLSISVEVTQPCIGLCVVMDLPRFSMDFMWSKIPV